MFFIRRRNKMKFTIRAGVVKENIYKWIFAVSAFASLLFLVGITLTLFIEGVPIFKEVGLFDFLFGKLWYPTYDPADFGILPLIMGTVWVTIGALVVGVILGVGVAEGAGVIVGEGVGVTLGVGVGVKLGVGVGVGLPLAMLQSERSMYVFPFRPT